MEQQAGQQFSSDDYCSIRSAMRRLTDLDRIAIRHPAGSAEYYTEGRALLREICLDPVFTEAVLLASVSVSADLEDFSRHRRPIPDREIARLILAVTKYWIRMSTRCTPFGLFAGFAVLRNDDPAPLRRLGGFRRRVSVDHEWRESIVDNLFSGGASGLERRYFYNGLCVLRGGRLYAPPRPIDARKDASATVGRRDRRSVRYTPAVQIVSGFTDVPRSTGEIRDKVCSHYPAAPRGSIERVVDDLIEANILVPSDRARPDDPDILASAIELLGRVAEDECVTEVRRGELERVRSAASEYERCDSESGPLHLRRLWSAMDMVHERWETPQVQVDTVLMYGGHIPAVVRAEARQAVEVMAACSPPRPDSLAIEEYLSAFVDAFGRDVLVPFRAVCDDVTGIGFPAYDHGSSSQWLAASDPPATAVEELADSASDALRTRAPLRLESDLIDLLSAHAARPPVDSLDVCFQLRARSIDSVEGGDFELWHGAVTPSHEAGAMLGRLLDEAPGRDLAAAGFRDNTAADESPVLVATLMYEPSVTRCKNVTRIVRAIPVTVNVNLPPDQLSREVSLDEIWVAAVHERLQLYVSRNGVETPLKLVNSCMLSMPRFAPREATLLANIDRYGRRMVMPWPWYHLEAMSVLPRVMFGRTVLSPGRWRMPSRLRAATGRIPEWHAQFDQWRRSVGVPDFVSAGQADECLTLDLRIPNHVEVLRSECFRGRCRNVYESPYTSDGLEAGWNDGFAAEIVFPVRLRSADDSAMITVPLDQFKPPTPHFPGSQWIYAKLFCPADFQNVVLGSHLESLLDGVRSRCDGWFFIRYNEGGSHLRVRFRLSDPAHFVEIVEALHRWCNEMSEMDALVKMELSTYRPETLRYGGRAIEEEVVAFFESESELALSFARLSPLRSPGSDVKMSAAVLWMLNAVDISRVLLGEQWWDAVSRFRCPRPKSESKRADSTARRAAREHAECPFGATPKQFGLMDDLMPHRRRWLEALQSLGTAVTHRAPGAGARLHESLLHMSFNRLMGIVPDVELEMRRTLRNVAVGLKEPRGKRPGRDPFDVSSLR